MRSVATIPALVVAFLLGLPPQWCQALPAAPFNCRAACADDGCGEESGDTPEIGCMCGKVPYKQPDAVPPLAIVPLGIVAPPALCGSMHLLTANLVAPPLNLQQLLCCWRK